MSALPLWLVQNALVATVMALLLAGLLRVWRPRPALEHALWLLVALKFVLPPVAVLSVPAVLPEGVRSAVEHAAGGFAPAAPEARAPIAPAGRGTGVVAAAPVAPAPSGGGPAAAPVAPSESASMEWLGSDGMLSGLALAWLLIALAAGLWRLVRHGLWLQRLERGHAPAPAALTECVRRGAQRLGVAAPVVRTCALVSSPLVTGLRRPVLYWPSALVGGLSEERADTIVAHELAHLRRRDLWSGLLELTIDCLWRWYPGWRLVRRRLRDAAERACDLVVVETYPAGRRDYAEAILDVLTLDARRRRPALALGVDGPGPMERRIERILQPSATSAAGARWPGYASLVLVAAILTPGWVPERDVAAAGSLPVARDAQAPAPAGAHDAADAAAARMAGVMSRGTVQWDHADRLPTLPDGGWLVAFGPDGDVMRRLELRRAAGGGGFVRYLADGRDARLDERTAVWLRDVFRRTNYDPARTSALSGSSASWVPDGSHVHRTDQRESLAFWSAVEGGIAVDGTVDDTVDAERPLYLLRGDGPRFEFFVLVRDGNGVRLLEHSRDARAAPLDAAAEARALAAVERVANWILRP